MITFNAYTNGFCNQPSSVHGKTPRLCEWVFNQPKHEGITIFEDGHIWQTNPALIETDRRIGWLHEARTLRPENYEAAFDLRNDYEFILTHDELLLRADPDKFKYTIRGGVTIPREDWTIKHKKRKQVAMLFSDKKQILSHQIRHEIADTVYGIDLFGSGVGEYASKEVLKEYKFAVVVDTLEPNLFTEHLLDVIALGCIPIYYYPPEMMGSYPLDNFLDLSEMFIFRSMFELRSIVDYVNEKGTTVYQHLYRGENLKRLGEYEVTEDYFTRRYFS